jgi:hypothetical protein
MIRSSPHTTLSAPCAELLLLGNFGPSWPEVAFRCERLVHVPVPPTARPPCAQPYLWVRTEFAYFRLSVSPRAVRQPHRRFGGFTASTSSGGLCGCSPSTRSRFALLRIAQRGRCNRLTISDTECFGHKVASSRSSSSVQRDLSASVMEAPSSSNVPADSCRALAIASFPHGTSAVAPLPAAPSL